MRAASSNQIYEHFQGNFSYSPICAANGSKTFIVSGGDVDFMRPEKIYGIPELERKRVDFLIRKFEVENWRFPDANNF